MRSLEPEQHPNMQVFSLLSFVEEGIMGYPLHTFLGGVSLLLDSERGNFKLFGLIFQLYLRKFELFGARLLKKRVLCWLTSQKPKP